MLMQLIKIQDDIINIHSPFHTLLYVESFDGSIDGRYDVETKDKIRLTFIDKDSKLTVKVYLYDSRTKRDLDHAKLKKDIIDLNRNAT
jgi:hypothetical protein